MILLHMYGERKINMKFCFTMIVILNIMICYTYYLFSIVIFTGEFIYFLIHYYKNKANNNKFFYEILFSLLLPISLMISYFILPYIDIQQYNAFYQLKLDGYYYSSGLTNFILFIPLVVYYIYKESKQNKYDIEIIFLIITVFIMLYIIYLNLFGFAKLYYASKFTYLVWLFCFIIVLKLFDKGYLNQAFRNIYYILYVLLFIISVFQLEYKVVLNNDMMINRRVTTDILDVYSFNNNQFKTYNVTFTNNEIEMLHYLYEIGATNVVNNYVESFNSQRILLDAFFWKDKLNYPGNEIFNYMVKGFFYDPIKDGNYSKISEDYKYYVIFYRDISDDRYINYESVIPFDVQSKWDDNFNLNYTINKKEQYDKLDRSTCMDCQFIDFDDGLIIINDDK